ncbi:MAG: hypothetical protein KAW89_01380 [Armatimonadetes bacterium]|nr:hypothetical protein [Armatimonadota bacterium]
MTRTIAGMLIAGIMLAVLLVGGCGGTDSPVTGPGMLFVTATDNGADPAVAIFDLASALSGNSTPDRYLKSAHFHIL